MKVLDGKLAAANEYDRINDSSDVEDMEDYVCKKTGKIVTYQNDLDDDEVVQAPVNGYENRVARYTIAGVNEHMNLNAAPTRQYLKEAEQC